LLTNWSACEDGQRAAASGAEGPSSTTPTRGRAGDRDRAAEVAVERQRWFVRVWLGLIVFIVACIAGLLIAASRYLH
jgi:hypothetical protein